LKDLDEAVQRLEKTWKRLIENLIDQIDALDSKVGDVQVAILLELQEVLDSVAKDSLWREIPPDSEPEDETI